MRCSRKFCIEDAVDGANYCQSHLKVSGSPRPGISNHRSASDGRFTELNSDNARSAAKRAAKPARKKAPQNPVLPGKASTIVDASSTGKKADHESSASASRKAVAAPPKVRGD